MQFLSALVSPLVSLSLQRSDVIGLRCLQKVQSNRLRLIEFVFIFPLTILVRRLCARAACSQEIRVNAYNWSESTTKRTTAGPSEVSLKRWLLCA